MSATSPGPDRLTRPDDATRAVLVGKDICGARSGGFTCTAIKRHKGGHVAYGLSGIVCARWPR